MARVERLVVVVDANHERPEFEAFTVRRAAETTDGRRIDDPRWHAGWSSATFFSRNRSPEARVAQQREHRVKWLREGYPRHPPASVQKLESMVSALRDAGVDATVDELRALPIAVEFTDAAEARMQDAAAGRLPDISVPTTPLWAKAIAFGVAIVLGAIFPSLNPYRAWKRQSWRGRGLTFLADWLVGAWAKGRRRSSR